MVTMLGQISDYISRSQMHSLEPSELAHVAHIGGYRFRRWWVTIHQPIHLNLLYKSNFIDSELPAFGAAALLAQESWALLCSFRIIIKVIILIKQTSWAPVEWPAIKWGLKLSSEIMEIRRLDFGRFIWFCAVEWFQSHVCSHTARTLSPEWIIQDPSVDPINEFWRMCSSSNAKIQFCKLYSKIKFAIQMSALNLWDSSDSLIAAQGHTQMHIQNYFGWSKR